MKSRCVEINIIYHPNEQKRIEVTHKKKVFVNSNFNQRYNYYVMQQKKKKKNQKDFFSPTSLLVLKIFAKINFHSHRDH